MATITAEAKLYNGIRLLCVDKNITANITATFTTGNYNRPIQPDDEFEISSGILGFKVLRTAAGIESIGSISLTDERYATYGGGNKAGVLNPAQPWTATASVACKFPTYVRFDLEALGVPEGTDLVLQMEEGFVIEGDYPGTERKPLTKVSNLLTFRTPKKFAVYPSSSFTVPNLDPSERIRPFDIDFDTLFTPNFAAISQKVGYIELESFTEALANGNYTAVFSSSTNITFSQSSIIGYLQFGEATLPISEFNFVTNNVKVRFFEISTSLSTESSIDGDRIRFGVTNLTSNIESNTITLDSRRRNTSSSITAFSSMTASLSIPVTETAVIENPSLSGFSRFGTSISIDGNNIVVGDAGYPNSSGTAYIFNATTGTLIRELANPNPVNSPIIDNPDEYGISSDIDGNYAVVGAWYEDGSGGSYQGRAYLFDITTGTLLQSETNPNSSTDYYFGLSVAIDGNQWAAGQNRDGIRIYPVTTGYSYTFSAPNASDRFFRVAISGNNVIVTVQRYISVNSEEYKLYYYTLSPTALVRTIDNPNPITTEYQDYFGWSLSVYGNYAVVGAPGEGAGRAYVFDLSNGNLLHTFSRPSGTASTSSTALENFGKSVDINDRYAVIADNNYVHLFDYVAGYHEKSIYVSEATEVSITDNKFVVATSESIGYVKVFSF